jgi:F-type H+-transporting ATPase subunit b
MVRRYRIGKRKTGTRMMSIQRTGIGPALFVLGMVTPAVLASEEGQAAEPNLFGGDLGNAFWTLLIFGLLVGVLAKWVWPNVLKGLQHREQFIHDSLAAAKTEREEAERLLAEYKKTLEKAQFEATAIVDRGRLDGEEAKKRLLAEAKTEGDKMVTRAKHEIELARDDAVKQLHDQTVILATSIAGKMIRRDLTPGDHKKLLDEALAELSKMN